MTVEKEADGAGAGDQWWRQDQESNGQDNHRRTCELPAGDCPTCD